MRRLTLYIAVLALCLGVVGQVYAIPVLQLYMEGGEYDTETETWVVTPEESSAGEPFRIWAIGNVAGPGGKGTIQDVRLSIAYNIAYVGAVDISLSPSQTGGLGVGQFNGFTDPSVPSAPILNTPVQTSLGEVEGPEVANGGTPVLGDGKNLPAHGIFGPDTAWREYSLGDFALTDSPAADFIGAFPTDLTENAGQINVYEVSALSASGATLHFDLYDTIEGSNHARFAPFSHDGDGDANIIPEPASVAVWSLLTLVGFTATWWRRRVSARRPRTFARRSREQLGRMHQ